MERKLNRQRSILYLIIVITITSISTSCVSDKIELEEKIKRLEAENDSLYREIRATAYIPAFFDAQCGDCRIGDTLFFDIGWLFNKEKLIDSITLTLSKYNNKNQAIEMHSFTEEPNFSLKKENYLHEFMVTDLDVGNYLLHGYVHTNSGKVAIQRGFEVK